MRIGELARTTDTPVGTIRYYEEIGLLPVADRTGSGYRRFGDEHVRYLRLIRSARGLGLSLDQIREILHAASDQSPPCDCVRDTLRRSIDKIDRRVGELQAMRSDLIRTLEIADRAATPGNSSSDAICPAIESMAAGNSHAALDSPVDWRV